MPFPTLRCAVLALVLSAGSAAADTRIFVIPGSDGYGIDRCLVGGEPCGQTIANAWCRSQDYARALDFGPISRTDTTSSVPLGGIIAARTTNDDLVAITCAR